MTLGDHGRPNDDPVQTESRRGALATMLAGTALGLSSLGGALSQDAEAKGKKGKKKDKRKDRNGGKGKGKGDGSKGGVGNGSLPSIRFVYTTTKAGGIGVVTGFSACPEGYLPISGGFFTSVAEPQVLSSNPRLPENDWEIEIDGATDPEQELTVIAICLAASDDSEAEDLEQESKSRGKRKRSRKN